MQEDEEKIPLIKVWDLEKQDRQGNPVCLKNIRTLPNNKHVQASAICVSDSSHMLAIGFVNGAIILYRGIIVNIRKYRYLGIFLNKL